MLSTDELPKTPRTWWLVRRRAATPPIGTKILSKTIAVLCSLLMTGCESFRGYPRYPVSTSSEINTYLHYFNDDVLATFDSTTPESKRVDYRDQVIDARLHVFDRMYDDFIESIGAEKNGEEMGSDAATVALTGTATLIGAASVKSILSGAATGLAGLKGTVDKNLFYQKTINVLISQMDAQRKTVLATIRTGQNQNSSQYPLSAALVDLDAYYRAGSLESAINALSAAAQAQGAKADQTIVQQLSLKFGPDANSKLLRTFWKPDGTNINTANQTKMQAAMKTEGDTDTSISDLMYSSDSKAVALRTAIVKDLALK
jgi:hypothetical protein